MFWCACIRRRSGGRILAGFIIPHSDGAGVIEAVGNGVSKNRIAERVWIYQAQFERHLGTTAQYVAVPSMTALTLPDNIGFDVGACLGIPLMTAHRTVFIHGDVYGLDILVAGASSRVGYYAAQLAKSAGARVIATAGSKARCRVARQTGADEVLNYRSDDLVVAITELTQGKGADRIVEVEFGINATISAVVLKNDGIISTYSSSLAPQPTIPFYNADVQKYVNPKPKCPLFIFIIGQCWLKDGLMVAAKDGRVRVSM